MHGQCPRGSSQHYSDILDDQLTPNALLKHSINMLKTKFTTSTPKLNTHPHP